MAMMKTPFGLVVGLIPEDKPSTPPEATKTEAKAEPVVEKKPAPRVADKKPAPRKAAPKKR